MVTCKCRYCGQQCSTYPLYFSFMVQQVANFIVDHPWCTVDEIERAVYGRTTGSNVVTNRVSQIKKALKGTEWIFRRRYSDMHHHRAEYRITRRPQPTGLTNAPTKLSPSL